MGGQLPSMVGRAITCVLPVLDEADCIEAVIRETDAALAALGVAYEIIAVDDGSTDGTGAVLDDIAAVIPALRVVHLGRNRGYGAALRTGFARARNELVFFMDSDGQFDPREIERLLARAEDAALVIGYRAERDEGLGRTISSRVFNWIARAMFVLDARDINCAFKLARRDVIAAIELTSARYCVNVELVLRARAAGFRVAEVPVTHRPRRGGRSKVRWRDVPRTLVELAELRRSLIRAGSAVRAPVTAPRAARLPRSDVSR